ncbi:hypothetical protein P154DRAFT_211311 [Amniculicola lignicola CBS 123094]|uniref:Uncharacterized protein n=1 Tax=Amniculicola lignicola CBS 123094 TaxID=1392246 RepID=A0A6A5WEM1_9PLEO|nr:hypothetical protein P154DRAFT_211311 [Amniculicola lignicola CBS 123094]
MTWGERMSGNSAWRQFGTPGRKFVRLHGSAYIISMRPKFDGRSPRLARRGCTCRLHASWGQRPCMNWESGKVETETLCQETKAGNAGRGKTRLLLHQSISHVCSPPECSCDDLVERARSSTRAAHEAPWRKTGLHHPWTARFTQCKKCSVNRTLRSAVPVGWPAASAGARRDDPASVRRHV